MQVRHDASVQGSSIPWEELRGMQNNWKIRQSLRSITMLGKKKKFNGRREVETDPAWRENLEKLLEDEWFEQDPSLAVNVTYRARVLLRRVGEGTSVLMRLSVRLPEGGGGGLDVAGMRVLHFPCSHAPHHHLLTHTLPPTSALLFPGRDKSTYNIPQIALWLCNNTQIYGRVQFNCETLGILLRFSNHQLSHLWREMM